MAKPIDCDTRDEQFKNIIDGLSETLIQAAVAGAQSGGVRGADHNVRSALTAVENSFPKAAPHILTQDRLSTLKEAIEGDVASHAPNDPALAASLRQHIGSIMHVDPAELGAATAIVDKNCQIANAPKQSPGRY